MLLALAPINVEFKIIKVLLDCKTKKHLENLSIIPNSKITVLENNKGNVILHVKEGRLALDKNVASKIIIA